jgi:hypothetical protein
VSVRAEGGYNAEVLRTQHRAVTDLQLALEELLSGESCVALVLDPERGWFVADAVRRVPSTLGESAPSYLVQAFESGRAQSLAEAVAASYASRFQRFDQVRRLFVETDGQASAQTEQAKSTDHQSPG